uniref:G-protein coupled receptors family 1 profile domain-containing protein n=1 Tax=Cavia porcellus TaxID=10141 RepID=A0A286XEY0_CAVPO
MKTYVLPSTFILISIPGLEAISTPFCMIYLLALDPSFHKQMYLFLCMLAVADLVVCTTAVPKLPSLFWFHNGKISLEACLSQVFPIHSCCTMESGFFLSMMFGILTHPVVGGMGLAIVLWDIALLSPHPFLLCWLPYCRTNIISHTCCEFMGLIKPHCCLHHWRVNFILILCSYVLILHTDFHLPSKDARLKTLGTCVSHVCVILVSYTPAFFSFLTYRFGIYFLVPPIVSPIIYGVRTKRIRKRFLRLLNFLKPLN